MRDTIEMAREAGFPFNKYGLLQGDGDGEIDADKMFKAFDALVRADEREQGQKWFDAVTAQHKAAILAERLACANKAAEFARKWWSIHCDSNKHMETTRKAHDDFCALQAAIRARGETNE
jgi:hypothetical protein